MVFSSSIFLFAFLPGALLGYYVFFRKRRKLQNIFLMLCSLFFYAWGEPLFVLVMMLSIILNWAFALWIDKKREAKAKPVLAFMLLINLGILFIFKYLTFTLENLDMLFGSRLFVPDIALPIGISFFTFQAVSYVIDIYRQTGQVQKNPLNVALYISFFPQLIAGPIVRYNTIAEQIMNRKESIDLFSDGICRFIVGLGKKVLIANNLALVADAAFAAENPSVAFAWLGALAYAFQIYYDFSGYSDMAIGLGRMFGFRFLENFNYPYISRSISEFWRRWHISLGTWFRDYVYFPLGGSRVSTRKRLVFNLFIVWTLTGIWHGANWTFLVWGLMYFVLIAFEKLTGMEKKLNWTGHIYAMFFVVMGWVVFRADSLTSALIYFSHMFGLGLNPLIDSSAILYFKGNIYFYIFAVIFSLPAARYISEKLAGNKLVYALYSLAFMLVFVTAVSYIIKGAYNPFIYFNF